MDQWITCRLSVTKVEDGKSVYADTPAATSIQIRLPDGLDFFQMQELITGRIAGEVARYAASECLTCLGHKNPLIK